MKSWLSQFRKSDDGAASIDWAVLTGAIVCLAIAVGYMITTAPMPAAEAISASLSEQNVN